MKATAFAAMAGVWVLVPALAAPLSPGEQWMVTEVKVDQADQMHWRYLPDDPALLGRVVSLDHTGTLRFNRSAASCARAGWRQGIGVSPINLMGETFARPPSPLRTTRPTLGDFKLQVLDRTVVPWRVDCGGPAVENSALRALQKAWWAPLADGRMLMAWHGEALLVLRRLAPRQPAMPSFACTGTLNAAETEICRSPALAGYDRSVAAAYQRARTRLGGNPSDLPAQQGAWLSARNACGQDKVCLEDRMRERVDRLMQE